jgi:quercetin dioxygenase-like cupin family protein
MAGHDTRSVLPSRYHNAGGVIVEEAADPKGNPIGTELVYEDDSVRVWRIELAPGETAGWHTHYLDYTTVVVEGDLVERPNADGTVDRIEVKPGAIMRWNQGTLRHALRNVGTKTFRNVIVEVKGRRTGA